MERSEVRVRINKIIKKIRLMSSFPKVEINISGGPDSLREYKDLTRPHPKYKIIQRKKWGVALLEIPDTFEEYTTGKSKELLRRKRKRALSKGYTFKSFAPQDQLEQIMIINQSMVIRQGRPMDPDYLLIEKVQEFFSGISEIYGVFDKANTLQAYGHIPIYGDVFLFNRLLGHEEHLNNGVMYLLISEVVFEMIEQKRTRGKPLWGMYDTFLGAPEGLWYFKERLGFKPYNVNWVCEK